MKHSQQEPLTAEEEALCNKLRSMAASQPKRLDSMQREKLAAHFRDSDARQGGGFRVWAWLAPAMAVCVIGGVVMLQVSREPDATPLAADSTVVATPADAEQPEETLDYLAWDSWEAATSRVEDTYWLTQSIRTNTLGDASDDDSFDYDFSDTASLLDSGSRQRLSKLRSELEIGI